MKIIFDYNKEKDIECLLKYGKGSSNSSTPTKVYEKLIEKYGENPIEIEVSIFVQDYITQNNINISQYLSDCQKDWNSVSLEYIKRAESLFQVSLPKDVTAYLTINNRCPYSIDKDLFFVSFSTKSVRKIVMHELWHFYTWYKFGIAWQEKIGKQKYNDLKEALTVLLNIECKDLLPEGISDEGYPQHKELREKIIKLWTESSDIDFLWENLVA